MPIFDHNQPKIIKSILNFPFLTRLNEAKKMIDS